jgi:hypothetical protein
MRRFAITVILVLFSVSTFAQAQVPEEYVLCAENEHLALYIHLETTEIAVVDKPGTTWYSNPLGAGRDVLQIRYDTPTAPDKLMDSYTHSVQLGQAEIVPMPSGVRVEYLFGAEYSESMALIPQLVKAEIFETEILAQVNSAEQNTLLRYYTPILLREPYPCELGVTAAAKDLEKQFFGDLVIVPLTDAYNSLVEEAQGLDPRSPERKALEEKIAKQRMDVLYGLLEKFTGYLLGSGEGARSVGYRKDITSASDLTKADFAHLQEEPSYLLARLAPLLQDQVERIFAKVGYGIEELTRDHVQNRLDPPIPSLERFFIPVEYILDGKELVVRIPIDEVVYPKDQPTSYQVNWDGSLGEEVVVYDHSKELVTYPLTSISLLRFFGALDEKAEGYIFVPDGCGALIYLNNGKTSQSLYSEAVYGRDGALPLEERRPYDRQVNHLPVFGMTDRDCAFLAVIEEGEAIAQIRADIARPTSKYNVAYAAFQIIPKAVRRLDQFTQINLYQSRPYQGNITVRYAFLYTDEADWQGMARYYHHYLVERKGLTPKRQGEGIPFFLEVIGVVPKTQPVLGVAREVQLPLTTFSQAQAMVEKLLQSGVTNLSLRYSGWLQGGLYHRYPNGVKLAPGLGGEQGLKDLAQFLRENQVPFYPAVEFLRVQRSGAFQGFTPSRQAARAVNGVYATWPDYDPVTNQALSKPTRYILSPQVLPEVVESFLKDYRSLGITGLAVPSLGAEVHSDLKRDAAQVVDRVQAAERIRAQLEKLNREGLALQIDGGNALALPYASSILNLPQSSTGYILTDEEVPFLQLVLHGLVDYAGEPLNAAVDLEEHILKAAQTVSGLYLRLIWDDAALLKETEYAHLLSVQREYWLEKGAEVYRRYNQVLGDLAGERLWTVVRLSPELTETWFENGDRVVVNFGDTEVEYEGYIIPARDFYRLKGVRWDETF